MADPGNVEHQSNLLHYTQLTQVSTHYRLQWSNRHLGPAERTKLIFKLRLLQDRSILGILLVIDVFEVFVHFGRSHGKRLLILDELLEFVDWLVLGQEWMI